MFDEEEYFSEPIPRNEEQIGVTNALKGKTIETVFVDSEKTIWAFSDGSLIEFTGEFLYTP